MSRWVLKINDERDGRGLAIFSGTKLKVDKCMPVDDASWQRLYEIVSALRAECAENPSRWALPEVRAFVRTYWWLFEALISLQLRRCSGWANPSPHNPLEDSFRRTERVDLLG